MQTMEQQGQQGHKNRRNRKGRGRSKGRMDSSFKVRLFCIILAGGAGSALQPLSGGASPKQMLKFDDDYTLFQRTFLNVSNLINDKNIITSVNIEYISSVTRQLSELQDKFCRTYPYKMIIEPVSRNTAPAVTAVSKYISENTGAFNENPPLILVMPSDEIFADRDILSNALSQAAEPAQNGYIVCFGTQCSEFKENTSYFKTKKSSALSKFSDSALKVSEYTLKPHKKDFSENDKSKLYANTGIYLFNYETYMSELKKYAKELYLLVPNMHIKEGAEPSIPLIEYEKAADISIEEALISKTKKLALIPLETEINTVDSWDDVYDLSVKDINGNAVFGQAAAVDCENTLIYSSGRPAAAIGVKDLIIAASEDGSLICRRGSSESVKKIYEKLNSRNPEETGIHKTVCRPWGYYKVLEYGDGFLTKCITVNPKAKLSLQKHFHRSEHWIVLEGEASAIKGESIVNLSSGESIDIDVEEVHSLQNRGNIPLQIIEVQMGDILDENDIERLSDIYGRV